MKGNNFSVNIEYLLINDSELLKENDKAKTVIGKIISSGGYSFERVGLTAKDKCIVKRGESTKEAELELPLIYLSFYRNGSITVDNILKDGFEKIEIPDSFRGLSPEVISSFYQDQENFEKVCNRYHISISHIYEALNGKNLSSKEVSKNIIDFLLLTL